MILWKLTVFTSLVAYGICYNKDTNEASTKDNTSGLSSEHLDVTSVSTEKNARDSSSEPSEGTSVSTEKNARDSSSEPSDGTSVTSGTSETETDAFSTPSETSADEGDQPLTNATTEELTGNGTKSTTQTDFDTSGDIILTTKSQTTDEGPGTTTTVTPTTYREDDTTTTTELTTTKGIIETACSLSPCLNNGNCTDNTTNPYLFECTCPSGYAGLRCEVTDKCVESEDGTLCKNGSCEYSKDGLERSCKCFIGEFWDEQYMECRRPDPPCFPNPCKNGGSCWFVHEDAPKCECPLDYEGENCTIYNNCGDCHDGNCVLDSNGTRMYCECNTGLYWNEEKKLCERESLPCFPNPCKNGGTCSPGENEEFNCTCSKGFSGRSCEVIDKCNEDDDCGPGACTLSEDETTRACQCENGFYLEEQAHTCQEIVQPCQPNPCSHGGICVLSSKTSFICVCPEGYTGRTCTVRDICKMDGGDDFCGDAACSSVQELEVFYCSCPEKQYFDYSERKCLDLDLCSLQRCAPTEQCVRGRCECKRNYLLNNDTGLCEPNFCSTNPCPAPDMTCEEGSGSSDYQCSCKDGYAFNGTHCNEVSCMFPQLNTCEQNCVFTEGGYECSCEDRFELNEDNRTCTYSGNETCTNKTCGTGSCVVENGIETCVCTPGYVKHNGTCVDICTVGKMKAGICPGDECEPVPGVGFKCKCEGKYVFSKDKVTCMVRNVCEQNEIGWKMCSDRNAMCIRDWNEDYGFRCECPEHLINTTGGTCREVCSIISNQQYCSSKGATCDVDEEGKRFCRCPPYFKANSKDGSCNKPADRSYLITFPVDPEVYQADTRQKRSLDKTIDLGKILRDVSLVAREMFYGFSDANIVSCRSESGYILCKIEFQFLNVQEVDLRRLKVSDVCVTVDNSNRCILPPSLILVKDRLSKDVSFQPTDPCDDDIKEELCGSETTCTSHPQSTRYFNCSCQPGFSARMSIYPFNNTKSFIETCKDIEECAEGDPCPANSDCVNTLGSFQCSCKKGFRRVEDQSDDKGERCIDLCDPNPCTHGQCSPRGDHEFDCTCGAGYRGTFCNLQDENYKEMRTNTVIVGVVLGGILLISIILFIACYSRLKKKKSLDESGNMYYSSEEMTERRRVERGAVNNAFRRE